MANLWELESKYKRGVLVKVQYMFFTKDLPSAILLSQIVYWHKPGKKTDTKLRVQLGPHKWIAKTAEMWRLETGLSKWQYREALRRLVGLGLVETRIAKFNGIAMMHIRLIGEVFFDALKSGLVADFQTYADLSAVKAKLVEAKEEDLYAYYNFHP